MPGKGKNCLMKKFFVFLFLMLHLVLLHGQIVTGTVLDKETGEKINYAAVYIDRSFAGTYTDPDGNFRIDVSANRGRPLSVSAIGYYSATIANYSEDEPVIILLTPKVYNLNEVVINAKMKARDRRNDLRIFREIFLGTSYVSRKCRILNDDDITFSTSLNNDTLRAFADNPLYIVNKALGYSITYYLDRFEYDLSDNTFFFKGNIIFKEDLNSKNSRKKSVGNERMRVYTGSRMHFFRELWANNLNESGFVLTDSAKQVFSYADLVTVGDDKKKYLSCNKQLNIDFYLTDEISKLVFLQDRVYFDSTGYFDASAVSWEGRMVGQRIGEELPYEFVAVRGNGKK